MVSSLRLSSDWFARHDDEAVWRPVAVPGSWEVAGFPKDDPGPIWYRTTFVVPREGARFWLHFGAVSYHCQIFVNGQRVAAHTGMWDAFRVEITDVVELGQTAELTLQIEKPASLTAGYQSPYVSGNFPLRETAAGFLPYVWGHAFGGVWQDVWLVTTGAVVIDEMAVRGQRAGGKWQVVVEAHLDGLESVELGQATVALTVQNPQGEVVYSVQEAVSAAQLTWTADIPDPQLWHPDQPNRYLARLEITGSDRRELPFGLRSLTTEGSVICLNNEPIYPRLILSWGWYPESSCPHPEPERVYADLRRLKEMGYNGVKLCLWFPPSYYFDIADELGMLLWLELPLWLPVAGEHFRQQTAAELLRLAKQARHHPSIILYTIGCELDGAVDGAFLRQMYAEVKALVGDALVRDNSGSAEAYGGALDEAADFYDHHFYADQQFMPALLDTFAPTWRKSQPWLFGEFCDYDSLRNIPHLDANRPYSAWWEVDNPQGVRAADDMVDQRSRLRESGLWAQAEALHRLSNRQALLHRKLTLELVRSRLDTSGYVVTGERDTPISTAGMWDDLGQDKFSPEEFRCFNQDTVILLGWRRRREWVVRGDRVAYWDPYCYRAGDPVRAEIFLSHFGRESGVAQGGWSVAFPGEAPFAEGKVDSATISSGQVGPIALIQFVAPQIEAPRRADLRVWVQIGQLVSENVWRLYFFPAASWTGIRPITLLDPRSRLPELAGMVECHQTLSPDRVGIFSLWTEEIAHFIEAGGRGILLLERDGLPSPVEKVARPFWRETLKFAIPHPAWGDFPEADDPHVQFYSMAPDVALDTSAWGDKVRPIFRRLDTRQIKVEDYAAELLLGKGRLIVTTLRLDGRLGNQPSGLAYHPAAVHLITCWVRYLQDLS